MSRGQKRGVPEGDHPQVSAGAFVPDAVGPEMVGAVESSGGLGEADSRPTVHLRRSTASGALFSDAHYLEITTLLRSDKLSDLLSVFEDLHATTLKKDEALLWVGQLIPIIFYRKDFREIFVTSEIAKKKINALLSYSAECLSLGRNSQSLQAAEYAFCILHAYLFAVPSDEERASEIQVISKNYMGVVLRVLDGANVDAQDGVVYVLQLLLLEEVIDDHDWEPLQHYLTESASGSSMLREAFKFLLEMGLQDGFSRATLLVEASEEKLHGKKSRSNEAGGASVVVDASGRDKSKTNEADIAREMDELTSLLQETTLESNAKFEQIEKLTRNGVLAGWLQHLRKQATSAADYLLQARFIQGIANLFGYIRARFPLNHPLTQKCQRALRVFGAVPILKHNLQDPMVEDAVKQDAASILCLMTGAAPRGGKQRYRAEYAEKEIITKSIEILSSGDDHAVRKALFVLFVITDSFDHSAWESEDLIRTLIIVLKTRRDPRIQKTTFNFLSHVSSFSHPNRVVPAIKAEGMEMPIAFLSVYLFAENLGDSICTIDLLVRLLKDPALHEEFANERTLITLIQALDCDDLNKAGCAALVVSILLSSQNLALRERIVRGPRDVALKLRNLLEKCMVSLEVSAAVRSRIIEAFGNIPTDEATFSALVLDAMKMLINFLHTSHDFLQSKRVVGSVEYGWDKQVGSLEAGQLRAFSTIVQLAQNPVVCRAAIVEYRAVQICMDFLESLLRSHGDCRNFSELYVENIVSAQGVFLQDTDGCREAGVDIAKANEQLTRLLTVLTEGRGHIGGSSIGFSTDYAGIIGKIHEICSRINLESSAGICLGKG